MDMADIDIRMAAFNWLAEMVRIHGDVLNREILHTGFTYRDERVPLVSPQGIFKPRVMKLPLSITSTTKSPYHDDLGSQDFLQYKYRGDDPGHPDNVGLRECMNRKIPLIYLFSLCPGKYIPFWPVFVIGDRPAQLTFTVAVDDMTYMANATSRVAENDSRREYITAAAKVRLHQKGFRERILEAYKRQCAICSLKHVELLDAAHIIPDSEPDGKPIITNGLAMCKLHHAAFDANLMGIRPDYRIDIRRDLLEEIDGPMLKYCLQGMQDKKIFVPRSEAKRPSQELLDIRYKRFLNSA